MMPPKEPILVVFDIDGTIAKPREVGSVPDLYADAALLSLPSYPNVTALVHDYLAKRHVKLLFCTGRPKRSHKATWRWLNQQIGLSDTDLQRATLACRPDDVPESNIPAFKLQEVVQALRRIGSKPAKAVLYDDDSNNLRIFETIRPMVRSLDLFRSEEGVISRWG